MTLREIADQLNAERVPTLRGGSQWRPSSIQVALGYRRPGPRDRGDVESGHPARADSWARPLLDRFARYEPVAVARELREGDALGHGFVVLEVPGHSAGHVAFWREADRTLVAGDVFFNLHMLTTAPGLREPPRALTLDPARNRDSARRLAALEPALVLFGHGPPLRDPARLARFVATLPRER